MVDEKTKSIEAGLILNQELCHTFQEKYIPFGLEESMPEDLRDLCGMLEGYFRRATNREKNGFLMVYLIELSF